jgi:hypothetical protein
MGDTRTSLDFMRSVMLWPQLVLPVKKRATGEVGVMRAADWSVAEPTVYTVNMFALGNYVGKNWEDIPHVDYRDLQAVVDDGWVVD